MSGAEQQQALMDARFANFRVELAIRGGLVLYVGERAA